VYRAASRQFYANFGCAYPAVKWTQDEASSAALQQSSAAGGIPDFDIFDILT